MKEKSTLHWHKWASAHYFEKIAKRFAPVCHIAAALLLLIGSFLGLFYAPADYQQGDAFRIIYVHVPVASMSIAIYLSMAVASVLFFTWNIKLAIYYCRGMAALGASFTALALITGALWGKPMWGTYWTWGDPRLLSELILLFLYLGYMTLTASLDNEALANKMGAILLIIGVVNIPIIHYSVVWWNSLHQGATLFKFSAPSIDSAMLMPLLINLLGMAVYSLAYALTATRTMIIEQRNRRRWMKMLGD